MPNNDSDNPSESSNAPGILILAGGQSQRMGVDKALLPLGNRCFLEWIVDQCAPWSGQIVVSVGLGQLEKFHKLFSANSLFQHVVWVEDTVTGKGPLAGIEAGLKALETDCRYAYVTGCDVPVVKRDLVDHLHRIATQHQSTAVTPVSDKRTFGMTAIYRTDSWQMAKQLLQEDQLRVTHLSTRLNAQPVELSALRGFDPELESFLNINHPQQYLDFLASRGESPSAEILEKFAKS